MTDERLVPAQTSTLAFEEYALSKPVLSSVNVDWRHLIVRSYSEPQTLERLVVPAVPDPHIVLQLTGSAHIEVRKDSGRWTTVHIQPGQLFLTPAGGSPYEMRWTSESNEPIPNIQLHLDSQFLAKTGVEAAGVDPSRIELLERSGARDLFIEQICLMLKQELERGEIGSKLYAESAAQLLAVHLLRQHCTFEHRVKEYGGGLPKHQLRRVTDYMQAHLDTDLSLNALAQQVSRVVRSIMTCRNGLRPWGDWCKISLST